jgi:hypothetical protein
MTFLSFNSKGQELFFILVRQTEEYLRFGAESDRYGFCGCLVWGSNELLHCSWNPYGGAYEKLIQ